MSERPVISATYESPCGVCLEPMYEGEDIALDQPGGEWCHLRCVEDEPWEDT